MTPEPKRDADNQAPTGAARGWAVVRHARRRRGPVAAGVGAIALGVVAGLFVTGSGPFQPAAELNLWMPAVAAGAAGGATSNAPAPTAAKSAPGRLRVPAIGVDTPLEELRLDARGALQTPRDFGKAGWYAEGTSPGDVGPAVIAGHVDSKQGPAVFFRLYDLHEGDVIDVLRDGAWLRFRVVGVGRYAKSDFPTARVYGPTPDAQLRLITCGGDFDPNRRSYNDNVVVYAVSA